MFEDQKEPEDIFSPVDPAANGKVVSPAAPNQSAQPEPMMPDLDDDDEDGGRSRTMVIVASIVIGLIVILSLVLVGIWFWRRSQPVDTGTQIQQQAIPSTPITTGNTQPVPVVPAQPVVVDTDADGLTDEEEANLGTDPTKADTDADGLSDREEVRVWNTDPRNADTDGDTFKDGQEVQAGYDPNVVGGKLLDINAAPSAAIK